jgi:hypothetical protein
MVFMMLIVCGVGFGQNFQNGFNFNLPPRDTTSKIFLPNFPVHQINNSSFNSIDDSGHFSIDGKRIRFWGCNLVGDGAVPDTSKAAYIAGRLRKMGFNLTRMHHLDNNWSSLSLLYPQQGTRQINAANLNRLEYLIAQLKKNGVYIDMNLNVSRTFTKADGIPDADSLVQFGKVVTIFDPQMIAMEKEYARGLLTHVNPFTGFSLANDPVMAVVEMVNENSLYGWWRQNQLKPFAMGGSLTIRYVKMLDSLWNDFLRKKYGSTTALAAAWNEHINPPGAVNMITNGGFESSILSNWQLEQDATGAVASISNDTKKPYQGNECGKVLVSSATGTAWQLQFKQVGATIRKDSLYTVTFALRADSSRTITAGVMRNESPYVWFGGANFLADTVWRLYSFSIRAPEDCIGVTRVTFQFMQKGTYWFDAVSMTSSKTDGLENDEALETSSVARLDYSNCIGYTDNRVSDQSEFYIALTDTFYAQMKDYLRNQLGVKVPIIGSNINQGPGDLISQSKMDYVDNHSYWDHPQFPTVAWSSTDWLINNTAMVQSSTGGTIPNLFSGVASVGKPLVVSEYNHIFPNRYQSEGPEFAAAYLSFHDGDGIMLFDYNSATDWDTDMQNQYFDIHRNTVMMAQMPALAKAFRSGMIAKAKTTIGLNFARKDILLLPKRDDSVWSGPTLYDNKIALLHGVRNASFAATVTTNFSNMPQAGNSPYKTDTGEITYDTDGMLTIVTPKFVSEAGFLNNFAGSVAGPLTITSANDFGVISWISLTDDSLPGAVKSLITVASVLDNTGMIWDGTTTVHNNWGNGPTLVYPLKLKLGLKVQADSIKVSPLDPTGSVLNGKSRILKPVGNDQFELEIDQSVVNSLWFGIEKFGNGVPLSVKTTAMPEKNFRLEQNYPNPFNPVTTIQWYNPVKTEVKIEIYDVMGRKINKLVDEIVEEGQHRCSWRGKNDAGAQVASGIYYAVMTAGDFRKSISLLLLK